jgi:hypothetical protein
MINCQQKPSGAMSRFIQSKMFQRGIVGYDEAVGDNNNKGPARQV